MLHGTHELSEATKSKIHGLASKLPKHYPKLEAEKKKAEGAASDKAKKHATDMSAVMKKILTAIESATSLQALKKAVRSVMSEMPMDDDEADAGED